MKIIVDSYFFSYLLAALDNQKFLPLPDKQQGYEVENQVAIDKVNKIGYKILYIQSDMYDLEELVPYLVSDNEYIRESAKLSYDRQQRLLSYLDGESAKIIDENSKYLSEECEINQ